jgi:hypothetical protein
MRQLLEPEYLAPRLHECATQQAETQAQGVETKNYSNEYLLMVICIV